MFYFIYDLSYELVHTSSGESYSFRVKKTTKMRKVMESFCDRTSQNIHKLRFVFDGTAIDAQSTPESVLGLEDEDLIEVKPYQEGGCLAKPQNTSKSTPLLTFDVLNKE
ncbi:hypothetical protein O9G_001507 [Rozella allomycis CSF55]|uniref:Ubiquitin-like domain-containing protein n=1 Tax=Rozella allomycis (strain CSF55) TaxID=988480 RepID=A0A075AMW5_ROZAC|nr:hypothetical protein O9G_001507 [Rozella allomycis CSF55]|eukprot:EPZ31033.1 hypothetical protein O9G_001507 [Rozella allomycis CSF55]